MNDSTQVQWSGASRVDLRRAVASFDAAGVYRITVNVIDEDGYSASAAISIVVTVTQGSNQHPP